jgi:hypothetical protein
MNGAATLLRKSSGVTLAAAKQDACMAKNAPGPQVDMKKRGDALNKAVLAIALGSGTPIEKKAKLRAVMQKHLDGNEQYTAILLSKCMGEVAATLREMSMFAQLVCKQDKSNRLCKNSGAVLAAQKKADTGKLTAKDMQALAKKMAGI